MKRGRPDLSRLGMNLPLEALLALIVAIALTVIAYAASATSTSRTVGKVLEGVQPTPVLERLSLVYWAQDSAWIANDGSEEVEVVKAWVDGSLAWTGSLEIGPGEVEELPIPRGSELVVETGSGNLITLRR